MSLGQLIEGLPIEAVSGSLEGVAVKGVRFDSRRVEPGDLFVAWPGEHFDGRRFVDQAIAKGAVSVLAKGGPLAAVEVPWLEADEPRRLLGPLAARIYGRPDRELITVGVTGTNGKTTVMFLVASILEAAGIPCGTLGTLGYAFHDHDFGGERTTPEASDLFALLRTMHDLGAHAASFEVSSHALDQGRVDETKFDVAVFTNLTRDHFDYHGDYENYFAAKRRLFTLLDQNGTAVICHDDSWGQRLLGEVGELAPGRRVLSYGESPASANPSGSEAVTLLGSTLDCSGLHLEVATPRGPLVLESQLLGRYNVWNMLAAVAVAEALGVSHQAVRTAMASQPAVPGRLERVDVGQDFLVLIDYAHTDGALEAALSSVRALWPGRLMVVFGCGGNRDQGKRPLMGRAAGRLADLAILTDDNPRDEDPAAIHNAVLEGLRDVSGPQGDPAAVEVIPDRRAAIRSALDRAAREPGWAVVVAGKGHESGQTIGTEVRAFSDRQVILDELSGASRGSDDHA